MTQDLKNLPTDRNFAPRESHLIFLHARDLLRMELTQPAALLIIHRRTDRYFRTGHVRS